MGSNPTATAKREQDQQALPLVLLAFIASPGGPPPVGAFAKNDISDGAAGLASAHGDQSRSHEHALAVVTGANRARPGLLSVTAARRLEHAPLACPAPVGGVLVDPPPAYRRLRRQAAVGVGRDRFVQAADRLQSWGMHEGAGVRVEASVLRVAVGAVALLRVGFGPFSVRAPVRVVHVVDEPAIRGFTYGTLPGHPEEGIESFLVELGDDGSVTATIEAWSRPASLAARASGPVGGLVQSWITTRYLGALAPHPAGGAPISS